MTGPAPTTMTDLVDVVVEDDHWNALDIAALAETAARAALDVAGLDPQGYEICVMACDDTRIAALNTSFRDKPGPTNVLSWPAFDLAPDAPGEDPYLPPEPLDEETLGDIAIAYETCLREAQDAGKPVAEHVTHLILHGCLHLLGYDHIEDADAAVMESLEIEALAKLGIPNPY